VRVSVPAELLRENSGMVYGYATPVGFESLSLARTWQYQHAAAGAAPAHAFNTSPSGLFYDVAPKLDSLNLAITLPRDSSFLSVKEPADPRAWLVTRFRAVPGWPVAIAAVAGGELNHQEAVIEAAWLSMLPKTAPEAGFGPARITGFSSNTMDVEVDTPVDALLVTAEAWYPGWRVWVDGREMPCLPANGWMRAAVVPAGGRRVRFVYREQHFLPGCLVSLATAGLLLVLWFRKPEPKPAL
jgi:hypothetical protein